MRQIHQSVLKSGTGLITVLISITVLFLFCISCDNTINDRTTIIIENSDYNSEISLMTIDTGQIRTLDSIIPGNNKQVFKVELSNPMLLILTNQHERVEFIAHPSDTIVIDLKQKKVTKSTNPENLEYEELLTGLDNANRAADSLSYVFIQGQYSDSFPEIREQVNKSFELLIEDSKEKAMKYIDENPGSIGIFRAINYFLKNTPLFNYSIDHQLFHKTDSLLRIHHPEHPYTISFHKRIQILARDVIKTGGVKAGQVLPQIRLKGLNSKIISVEPEKDKLTLVYLWDHTPASRRANTALKQINEEFKERGLKIYAVAFDENIDRWSSVIVVDKMWWNNMIDTSGYNSLLLNDLKNPALPYFIIVDHNRKILSTHINALQTREWLRNYYNKE